MLLVDCPDVPEEVWIHWMLWNLPPDVQQVPEGYPPAGQADAIEGARQGTNGFGERGYSGPCPPAGVTNTYRFRLFALDSDLDLEEGADRDALEAALDGRVLEETVLTCIYHREGQAPKVLEEDPAEQL